MNVITMNMKNCDLEFQLDPLFKNMTSRFNSTSSKGLILKVLPLSEDLDVMLEMDNCCSRKSKQSKECDKQLEQNIMGIIYVNQIINLKSIIMNCVRFN